MICSYCNREIPDGSTFCGYCGNKTEIVENTAGEVTDAASESPASVDNAVESQPVSEAAEQAASFDGIPQPVSEAVEQAASFDGVPQPVSDNASWASNAAEQITGGSSAYNGMPVQGMQPNMADNGAAFAGQAAVEGSTSGGKAFNISALLKNKLFLICVGAVVLLVVLIIIIANVAASGASKNPKKGSYFNTRTDDEAVVLYNGNVVKGTDLSYYANGIAESLDGTKMLVSSDGELILFDNGKQISITDELYSREAKLSDSGAVAYISDDSLYVYSGNKSKEIAELDDPSRCEFAISPDGGTVVFAEYSYDDDDYWRENKKYKYLNAWNGKNIIDLDDKFGPQYVSNGGKLICGSDANGKFTYLKNMKPGSAEKLKTFSGMYPVSADYSKIMYYSSDGGVYYFDSGLDDSIKVSSKDFTILLPGNYPGFPKNLNSFYATSNGGIYRYVRTKDSYDSEKIVSKASNVMMSADGKTIIYQDGDEILKVSISNPDKEITVAEDVYDGYYYYNSSFRCDPSLKHVYYLDDDGELRYASKQSKKIASDIDDFGVNDKGMCVFLTDDGDLYYSSKGGDKVKISGISDVEGMMIEDNIFYAATDDTLYVSMDGKNFKKTVER